MRLELTSVRAWHLAIAITAFTAASIIVKLIGAICNIYRHRFALHDTFIQRIKVPFVYSPPRDGDVESIYADVSLAKSKLGWVAKKSLSDMCKDSWNWKFNNPYGY